MTAARYLQFCALARAAEILGERWTLLIVRELLLGPKRFSDLKDRLNDISPTLLTSRLAALTECGVIRRSTLSPSIGVQTYELTEIGRGLQPAIRELIRWGGHFLFPAQPEDKFEPEWALLALEAIALRTPSPRRKIALRVRHKEKSAEILVEGGAQGTRIAAGGVGADAIIDADFASLLRLIAGALSIDDAVAQKLAKIEGAVDVAGDLPRLFDLRR